MLKIFVRYSWEGLTWERHWSNPQPQIIFKPPVGIPLVGTFLSLLDLCNTLYISHIPGLFSHHHVLESTGKWYSSPPNQFWLSFKRHSSESFHIIFHSFFLETAGHTSQCLCTWPWQFYKLPNGNFHFQDWFLIILLLPYWRLY